MAKRFMILGTLVIVGLISVSAEAFLFSGEMKEKEEMPICPGVANLQGEMVIADFDDFCSTVEFIKNQVFANMGIDPNTPLSGLGTLGKEIQPILDILNNPAQFKELVEKGKVTESVEYGAYNVETFKALVIRRRITIGDLTVRLVQTIYPKEGDKVSLSEANLYSMQVTKGKSTTGIVFNNRVLVSTEGYGMPAGTIITASTTYNSENMPANLYPAGSVEPLSWEAVDMPSDFAVDPWDFSKGYYCPEE